jgi:hypothetical protein
MTANATDITARRRRTSPLPHLPAVARDPLDDAKEALAAFGAKQAGQADICYADLCESMAAALSTAVTMLSRPVARPVLRPMALLEVAQAEKFLLDLERHSASIISGDPAAVAYLLGQAERHLARMSDLVRALTGLPR